MSYVALIAGEGLMPLRAIQELRSAGKKILLVAVKGITPENLVEKVDQVVWGSVTQLGKARALCLKLQIKEAVMVGRIRHENVFGLSLFKMDWVTLRAFISLKDLRANTICRKIIEVFQNKGISFIDTTQLLKKYLAKKGVLTSHKPSKKVLEDIDFGTSIVKELGRHDIGQCVVIKNKSIVAVEAMEGTDQCLQRAGDIAGKGCVVVKLAKPEQDTRFDVPTIGKNTIEKLIKIQAAAMAVESEKTLIIEDGVIELASQNNISIVAIESK